MSPISNAAEAVKLQPFHLFGIYLNSAKVEKFSKIIGMYSFRKAEAMIVLEGNKYGIKEIIWEANMSN